MRRPGKVFAYGLAAIIIALLVTLILATSAFYANQANILQMRQQGIVPNQQNAIQQRAGGAWR